MGESKVPPFAVEDVFSPVSVPRDDTNLDLQGDTRKIRRKVKGNDGKYKI
jgi:hypothetical protein